MTNDRKLLAYVSAAIVFVVAASLIYGSIEKASVENEVPDSKIQ